MPPSSNSSILAVQQARCEVTSYNANPPIDMQLSQNILARFEGGSDLNTKPRISVVDLTREWDARLSNALNIFVGLAAPPTTFGLDVSRRLVYAADDARIKAYRWEFGGGDRSSTLAHTFNSAGYVNAVTLTDGGSKLLRSGRHGIAAWDIDAQPAHETTVENPDAASEGEGVESFAGTPPTHTMDSEALADVKVWKQHPSEAKNMPVAYDKRIGVSCASLETQQTVTRYVGHGQEIRAIATSGEDPNFFVTGAGDGGVRLYDVRIPAPVFVIDHCTEPIHTVLYEHISSHPFFIIGGSKSQQVKLWDARARLPLYELSTGNNAVAKLAWDAPRQDLYAETRCRHVDKFGQPTDYRKAEFNDGVRARQDTRAWPEHAYHREFSFGYPLDSGNDWLYRYRYKADADVKVLPAYGTRKPSSNYRSPDVSCLTNLVSLPSGMF
ncbi:WD40-repeat-containing domain protein [Amylostereum chailletii]|nr:WD40-repeat-containing domain protein [Amylostereum chailletii]